MTTASLNLAALRLISCSGQSGPGLVPCPSVKILSSGHRQRILQVSRAMKPSDDEVVSGITNNSKDNGNARGGWFPLWIKWLLGLGSAGVIIVLAIPLSKRAIKFEGEMEKKAKTTLEDVENLAPMVEKVTETLAFTLPKDSKMRKELEVIDKMAEEAGKDAKRLSSFMDKVDDMKEKVGDAMEPLVDKWKK